jgi:hypothetical protein
MSDDTPASSDVVRFHYSELAEAEVIALCAFEPDDEDEPHTAGAQYFPVCTIYTPD